MPYYYIVLEHANTTYITYAHTYMRGMLCVCVYFSERHCVEIGCSHASLSFLHVSLQCFNANHRSDRLFIDVHSPRVGVSEQLIDQETRVVQPCLHVSLSCRCV